MTEDVGPESVVYRCPVCNTDHHGEDERDDHAAEHPGVKPDAFVRA